MRRSMVSLMATSQKLFSQCLGIVHRVHFGQVLQLAEQQSAGMNMTVSYTHILPGINLPSRWETAFEPTRWVASVVDRH